MRTNESIGLANLPAPPVSRPPARLLSWLFRSIALLSLVVLWEQLLVGRWALGTAWLATLPGLGRGAFLLEGVAIAALALTSLRTLLWLQYRPVPARGFLPNVTAIVPAYNEGKMVHNALLSLVASDYPPESLRIICIDDGSKDDTWTHMRAAAAAFPDRITLIRQPFNQGKRAALLAGFSAARGEVVVTVDSDCVVAPDAIQQLVAPLEDPKVGAVAGRVTVYNRGESLLTRLLAPQFNVTFDILRAAQSVNGTVLCCPGALSAYRVEPLRDLLPRWSTQTFLGRRVAPGEDRYLTTLFLLSGYQSRYQSTARVQTLIPASYGGICRMLLRWDRSDIRESLAALVRWPRRRGLARLASVLWVANALTTLASLPMAFLAIKVSVVLLLTHPLLFLFGVAMRPLPNVIRVLECLSVEWNHENLYLLGYACLSPIFAWIRPYAALTARDQGWMSRGTPALPSVEGLLAQPSRPTGEGE